MILSRRPDADRFLASPGNGFRAALIYGRDRSGVRERADLAGGKLCSDLNDPFGVAQITESDIAEDAGRLETELQALSMTGGARLVRVRLTGEKPAHDRALAEALNGHVEGRFNPEAFLLIEAGALGRDSALRKSAEKAAACAVLPVYDDEAGDVARLVREALARDDLTLTAEALDLLVARLPHERGVVRAEIERLAVYLGPGSGRTAGAAELAPFLGVEPEASLSDAAFDAFGGRAAQAQAGLRRAFSEGEAGPSAVRAAGMHLGRLRRIATLTGAGTDGRAAAKSAGVFWKQEREVLRQTSAWTLDQIDAVQPEVLEADRACKTSGYPDALIAERLILMIAQRAKRLGL